MDEPSDGPEPVKRYIHPAPAGVAAGAGGVGGRVTARAGRKTGGMEWVAKLIIDDMFRHAVFAWLAVAGPVAAAAVRVADSSAGYSLAGKRS
jgi:hypothetical protein